VRRTSAGLATPSSAVPRAATREGPMTPAAAAESTPPSSRRRESCPRERDERDDGTSTSDASCESRGMASLLLWTVDARVVRRASRGRGCKRSAPAHATHRSRDRGHYRRDLARITASARSRASRALPTISWERQRAREPICPPHGSDARRAWTIGGLSHRSIANSVAFRGEPRQERPWGRGSAPALPPRRSRPLTRRVHGLCARRCEAMRRRTRACTTSGIGSPDIVTSRDVSLGFMERLTC
jgi:hypothetical protein